MAFHDKKSRSEVAGTVTMAVFGLALMGLAIWQSTERSPEPAKATNPVEQHKPETSSATPRSLVDPAVREPARPVAVRLPSPPVQVSVEKQAEVSPDLIEPQMPEPKEAAPLPATPVQKAARQPKPHPVKPPSPVITPLQPKTADEAVPLRQTKTALAPLKPRPLEVKEREPVVLKREETAQLTAPLAVPRKPLEVAEPEAQRAALPQPPRPETAEPEPQTVRPEPAVTVIAEAREQAAVEADGRILLRLLEHDSGPSIQIAWPERASYRERLYTVLSSCHGMESAWISPNGQVVGDADLLGRDGSVDMDGFSGFVREARGALPRAEIAHLRRIAKPSTGARVVRLFPRRVDAILLGGLRRLIGADYTGIGGIVARYRLSGRDVMLEDIRIDGMPLNHTLVVAPTRRCAV